MSKLIDVRVAEKPVITIEETAVLFSIGENKIRNLIANNPRAEWILRSGSWVRIKRKPFERMIEKADAI